MVAVEKLAPFYAKHCGYSRVFAPGQMTLGFILPLEAYPDRPAPTMTDHQSTTRLADELGFAALWARDVPTYDPSFGDVGQVFDPFTYLGYLAGNTKRIALGTASTVITLRHPLHLAKQASSVDQLSGGRLLLGVASGDRPVEYPSFGLAHDYESRGERFREAFEMFRTATETSFPVGNFGRFGALTGNVDTVPKPSVGRIPSFVTGRSRQDLDWIAQNADGWLYYYVALQHLGGLTTAWQDAVRTAHGDGAFRPFIQGMFLDLEENADTPLRPIHAGLRGGRNALVEYLRAIRQRGVQHVMFNTKPSRRPLVDVMHEMGEFVLPEFPSLIT